VFEGLSYDDVLLVPQLGVLEKRKDADLTSVLFDRHEQIDAPTLIDIPIISAPMPSVTEGAMAKAMKNLGGAAVIHRFQTPDQQISQWEEADRLAIVAIGLKNGWSHFQTLLDAGVTAFCLDVAHGHHQAIGDFLENIADRSARIKFIVGNVATAQGAAFLIERGADAIKVGIGPGAACRTREVTGFGVPQLTAIMNVREQIEAWGAFVPIIADGGIKNSGDAVKALAAGASTIMLGSLLAGADESPTPGEYYGNASGRLNGHRAPEGVDGVVPLSGPVEDIVKELAWGIRSGISYAGATNIDELRENAQWIRVAPGAALESSVRV
jgi:IMP dehydrogenase